MIRVLSLLGALAIFPATSASVDRPKVEAVARVIVTPGSAFTARFTYGGPGNAAYVRVTPNGTTRYITDETGATQFDDKGRQSLAPGMRAWVLGHEFHAQLLFFDELTGGSTVRDA